MVVVRFPSRYAAISGRHSFESLFRLIEILDSPAGRPEDEELAIASSRHMLLIRFSPSNKWAPPTGPSKL